MNYFEFYNLPLTFFPDPAALKKTWLENSKKYHPDFHTLASGEQQAEALELSSLNNLAYKTLSDFERRMKYILELKGALKEEGKNQIPQDFLLEVMDINESLMDLEFDFYEQRFLETAATVKALEQELFGQVEPFLRNFDEASSSPTDLEPVKNFFLKKRYLLRILENLNKFAPVSKETGLD